MKVHSSTHSEFEAPRVTRQAQFSKVANNTWLLIECASKWVQWPCTQGSITYDARPVLRCLYAASACADKWVQLKVFTPSNKLFRLNSFLALVCEVRALACATVTTGHSAKVAWEAKELNAREATAALSYACAFACMCRCMHSNSTGICMYVQNVLFVVRTVIATAIVQQGITKNAT